MSALHSFDPSPALINDIRRNVGHFDPNPYENLGETDSGHGVIFGEMSSLGAVAVKPFTKLGKAEAERRSLEAVANQGFDALEPLDVAAGAVANYLITRRRPNLRNLGQLDWRADIASPHLRQTLEPAILLAAETAASWHNARITHGDMKAKNLAFGRNGGSVFIDAEKTMVGSNSSDQLTFSAHKDLTAFGHSLLRTGFLADRSSRYRARFLEGAFVAPYLELVKPENFTLSPEVRAEAVRDWLVSYMDSPGHRLPSSELPGVVTPRP